MKISYKYEDPFDEDSREYTSFEQFLTEVPCFKSLFPKGEPFNCRIKFSSMDHPFCIKVTMEIDK